METELKYLNDINTICNQIIQGYAVVPKNWTT